MSLLIYVSLIKINLTPPSSLHPVTGFNLYAIGLIVCVVCLFYTILVGSKIKFK